MSFRRLSNFRTFISASRAKRFEWITSRREEALLRKRALLSKFFQFELLFQMQHSFSHVTLKFTVLQRHFHKFCDTLSIPSFFFIQYRGKNDQCIFPIPIFRRHLCQRPCLPATTNKAVSSSPERAGGGGAISPVLPLSCRLPTTILSSVYAPGESVYGA